MAFMVFCKYVSVIFSPFLFSRILYLNFVSKVFIENKRIEFLKWAVEKWPVRIYGTSVVSRWISELYRSLGLRAEEKAKCIRLTISIIRK